MLIIPCFQVARSGCVLQQAHVVVRFAIRKVLLLRLAFNLCLILSFMMNEMIFTHTYLYTDTSATCLNVCSFYCVWTLLFLFLLFTISTVVISAGNTRKDERDSHMKTTVDMFPLDIIGFRRKLRLLLSPLLKKLTMDKNHVSIFVP